LGNIDVMPGEAFMEQGDETKLSRIVVGMDLSETGDQALLEALRLGRQPQTCELHITHVIEVDSELHDAKKLDALFPQLRSRLELVRERVAHVAESVVDERPFRQELVFHIRLGKPAEALHQVAVDVDADLLVVGAHPKGRLERLMTGTVADALMRMSHVSLLVAHRKDFSDLRHSDHPEAPHPHDPQRAASLTDRLCLEFVPRTTHISGLI
jgi:nucleotide-binding universal stress UspA family protein